VCWGGGGGGAGPPPLITYEFPELPTPTKHSGLANCKQVSSPEASICESVASKIGGVTPSDPGSLPRLPRQSHKKSSQRALSSCGVGVGGVVEPPHLERADYPSTHIAQLFGQVMTS